MSEQTNPGTDVAITKHCILVTGDVLVDHHIYEGERHRVSAKMLRGLKCVRELGGACLVERLLKACFEEALVSQRQARRDVTLEMAGFDFELAKLIGQPGDAGKRDAEVKRLGEQRSLAEKRLTKLDQPLQEAAWECAFALTEPDLNEKPCAHHALATWKPYPLDPGKKGGGPLVWRAEVLLGYGHDEQPIEADGPKEHCDQLCLSAKQELTPESRIVVLDDGGFLFRQKAQEHGWMLPPAGGDAGNIPDYYVLKMSDPVAQGDLWVEIESRKKPCDEASGPDISDRLIVIVSANDLRHESTRISRGLSWESTVEDVASCLCENRTLQSLVTVPRHLIVTFSADGALWLDLSDPCQPAAHLIFDADGAEGEWAETYAGNGEAFGYHSCLTAGVTLRLCLHDPCKPLDLRDAIATGLAAMRDLRREGHGRVEDDVWPRGFPVTRLARVLNKGAAPFANIRVPWPANQDGAAAADERGDGRPWRLLESSQAPFGSGRVPSMIGISRQYAIRGAKAIECLPHARFGDLITADREEIETLRTLRGLMLDYKKDRKAKKPLSIGIFGPPGAGKSFGVRQIATAVFGAEGWKEFNLSQFHDGDLIGAFHQIRDLVLSGIVPVAFWDEFDSRDYHWLQYLLAPMQDGQFQEQQITHPIGKCVFLFAGGTAWAYEEFGPRLLDEEAMKAFRLKKGPDFHSRLDGYYDVLGPNRRTCPDPDDLKKRKADSIDVCAPLRRAILVRHSLGMAKSDQRLDIDRPLLDALLEVGAYRHGARSLEKLVQPLKPESPSAPIRPSQLPPDSVIEMHTESPNDQTRIFTRLLAERSVDLFANGRVIDELAERIHESWRSIGEVEGWPMAPHLNRPYAELEEADREDNRAAARRMPGILALVGLTIAPVEEGVQDAASTPEAIQAHLVHHADLLAEAEHDGWMDRKIQSGWRHAKVRNDGAKQHDCLVPYKELADFQKAKDRDSVRHFQDHLKQSRFRIVFAKSED